MVIAKCVFLHVSVRTELVDNFWSSREFFASLSCFSFAESNDVNLIDQFEKSWVFFGEITDDTELSFASIDDEEIRKKGSSDGCFGEFESSRNNFFQ